MMSVALLGGVVDAWLCMHARYTGKGAERVIPCVTAALLQQPKPVTEWVRSYALAFNC